MDPLQRRRVGRSKLEVTVLGFGGAPFGDPAGPRDEATVEATLAAAHDAGLGFFDTAPWYGNTKSEHRFGHLLRQRPRDSYAISTKVGRVYFRPAKAEGFFHARWTGGLPFDLRFDYSYDGVMRSYEDSLMRLGLNRVDALVIHDLDMRHQRTEARIAECLEVLDRQGGFRALAELRSAGEIKAIGAGINLLGMVPRFLERFDLDYFLMAMPYTLMDQPALDEELPLCERRGVGVVIGAVFASGILASGPAAGATYAYQPPEPETVERVRRIQAVCARHKIPVAAAALQFPLAHPAVAAVIPGAERPEQVRENVAAMRTPIPADLWAELKREGLLRQDAPVPA